MKTTPSPVSRSDTGPSVAWVASRFDAASLGATWVAEIEQRAKAFLEIDPDRPAAAYLRKAVDHARQAERAVEVGDAQAAAIMAAGAMCAAWQAEMIEARERWFEVHVAPLADTGRRFRGGRKAGSAGPVRLAIRRVLSRNSTASALQVWEAINTRPPKGMALYDSPRLGKYIETKGRKDTGWARFQTIVSEERNRKPKAT